MEARTLSTWVAIARAPVSCDAAVGFVSHAGAGGVATFMGVVRDESDGRAVATLEYSAYESMAVKEMERIALEIAREIPGVRIAALHRIGMLRVGDVAIVCTASAPHRGEAFTACRALIDRIKERVPIWKRETGPGGTEWVGWVDARCTPDHAHAHPHGHDHGHD